MKRLSLIVICGLIGASTLSADKYKVLYVNNPEILVNGKACKVGDVFDDAAVIKWSKERQAIRVYNLDKRKQEMLVAYKVTPHGVNVKDILTGNMHLSTRDNDTETSIERYNKLSKVFAPSYELMDEIVIDLPFKLSKKQYFLAEYMYGKGFMSKQLDAKKKKIKIDRSLFYVNGFQYEPQDTYIDIYYIDDNNGTRLLIKSGVKLYVIPESL